MADSWLTLLWEWSLIIALFTSTLITFILVSLPSRYAADREPTISPASFSSEQRQDEDSGYSHFTAPARPRASVTIFVLGDIGRSPRMQYHATSMAKYGGTVQLVGYHESEVLPEIQRSRLIEIVPLKAPPAFLKTESRILFLLLGPLKVVYQTLAVYYALGYSCPPAKFMLVQNPPSIPTLAMAQLVCTLRHTKLVVDWHNLGHTILALKLGPKHVLVKLSQVYEKVFAGFAYSHITVSEAMARLLRTEYGINAVALHDRPAKQFQPVDSMHRLEFLQRLQQTSKHAQQIAHGQRRLLVSSTSWTADEDFSLLLDALVAYSSVVALGSKHPRLEVIITGKGPLKGYYLDRIAKLEQNHKLGYVRIHTAWLSMDDYALLLGCADLGVSLHMSSSGVDLPMKVVDMFGAGLPVVGWDAFEAWPELVHEGQNGRGFKSAAKLESLLEELFKPGSMELIKLRQGAVEESKRRWEDEWPRIKGLFGLE